jgi:hypothetical protein
MWKLLLLSLLLDTSLAQAPAGTSPCDYYSAIYYPNDNGTISQRQWITQFTINAFGGNNTVFGGASVDGILSQATYNGTTVHLVKYFDGSLYNINANTNNAASVNILDGGGVLALQSGMLANSNTTNQ